MPASIETATALHLPRQVATNRAAPFRYVAFRGCPVRPIASMPVSGGGGVQPPRLTNERTPLVKAGLLKPAGRNVARSINNGARTPVNCA